MYRRSIITFKNVYFAESLVKGLVVRSIKKQHQFDTVRILRWLTASNFFNFLNFIYICFKYDLFWLYRFDNVVFVLSADKRRPFDGFLETVCGFLIVINPSRHCCYWRYTLSEAPTTGHFRN